MLWNDVSVAVDWSGKEYLQKDLQTHQHRPHCAAIKPVMMMMHSRSRLVVAPLLRRALSTASRIPVGAQPQVLATVTAPHESRALNEITKVFFEAGASIAASKKVSLEGHCAMMFSLWLPPKGASPTPAAFAETLSSVDTTSRLGFPVSAQVLSASAQASALPDARAATRRLKLTLPQRPGIVLGVTELLKDYGCRMSAIDADTGERGGEIWFEIEALIEVPGSVDPADVESAIRFWTESKDARATLAFDGHTGLVNPVV